MAVRVPEVAREAWGDEVVAAVVPWMKEIAGEEGVPRDEYREVLSRLDVLEHDVADVKVDVRELRGELRSEMGGLRGEMHERFDRMYQRSEERFDRMYQHFEGRFDQVNERFDRVNERMLVQTRWLIGSIALFGTILTIMMAIAQFAP